MWTSSYKGETCGRTKIAKHKVTRPLKQGGLGLINPEHAATTSVLSSIASLFRHCFNNPTCMFNSLEYVTEENKTDGMAALNGANLPTIRHIFRNAFPPRANSIFEPRPAEGKHAGYSLPEVLNKLERDEHLVLLAPTYNHSKEPTGNLFIQPLETETLRKFGQPDALPNIASLCRKIKPKSFDIRVNSVELNALADGPQKTNLIQLRENVARSLGSRAETPLVMSTLTRRNTYLETWGIRIAHPEPQDNLFETIKQGISRIFRKQTLQDGPEQFVPDSYRTRIADQIDVPRDHQLYKRSYVPLTYQSVPAIIRSNHLEYLNRTMNSRTKQVAMNMPADDHCNHCGVRASTDHVLNECVLATLHRKIFTSFFTLKGWRQPLLREDTFHAFFWWPEQIWSNAQYRQLFTMWAVLRHHAQILEVGSNSLCSKSFHRVQKSGHGCSTLTHEAGLGTVRIRSRGVEVLWPLL